MNYLVDTDVLSESTKPKPDDEIIGWLKAHQRDLYISAITIGEIRFGIDRLPNGKRRRALQDWLTTTARIMDGRVLSFYTSVAHVWGQLRAKLLESGTLLPTIDGQIAATAMRHGLTVVTKNEKDYELSGVKTLNPSNS